MVSSTQKQWFLMQYRTDPCRTLPNAYGKTMSHPENLQLEYSEDNALSLAKMAVWQGDRWVAFWCSNPGDLTLTDRLVNAPLALVHADALPAFSALPYTQKEAYFRLIHKDRLPDYNCPPGFKLVDVDPGTENQAVAALIRACYSEMQIDQDIVSSWIGRPVYEPKLWVWVMDTERGVPAGLGIAEFDEEVPEASLEWIQVLPSYRGRGLGKTIVTELLRRVSGRVDFTTVSGKVDNATHPEHIYRQCGFTGSDVWWLLVR